MHEIRQQRVVVQDGADDPERAVRVERVDERPAEPAPDFLPLLRCGRVLIVLDVVADDEVRSGAPAAQSAQARAGPFCEDPGAASQFKMIAPPRFADHLAEILAQVGVVLQLVANVVEEHLRLRRRVADDDDEPHALRTQRPRREEESDGRRLRVAAGRGKRQAILDFRRGGQVGFWILDCTDISHKGHREVGFWVFVVCVLFGIWRLGVEICRLLPHMRIQLAMEVRGRDGEVMGEVAAREELGIGEGAATSELALGKVGVKKGLGHGGIH